MRYNYILVLLLLLLGTGVQGQQTVFWSDDFETDKGWTLTGEFERDMPSGGSGDHGNANPTSANSGSYAIGTDLNGGYPNNLTDRQYVAISPIIDCTGYMNVQLDFQRWLNVEQGDYDHAYVEVSTNGVDWHVVWENGSTTTIEDNSWTTQAVDLLGHADNKSTVQIRFALGSTDLMWNYSGWNIDDVELTGVKSPFNSSLSPNLVYWLRADQNITAPSGITNWGDLSGNDNDAVNDPTEPQQKTSNFLNNQKILLFNGNEELNILDNYRINSGSGYNGNERSMAIAFRTGSDVSLSTPQYIYEQGGGTNGLGVFIKDSQLFVTVYTGNGGNRKVINTNVDPNTDYVLSFIWNNGTLSGTLNNVALSAFSSAGTLTTLASHGGDISIGFTDGTTRGESGNQYNGGNNFTGEIAELIYFDKAINEAEEAELITSLATRYGITISAETIYYSYRSGNWNDVSTWTHDPGGTTHTATDIPGDNAKVVLLNGRTVTLNSNVNNSGIDLAILSGAFLNMSSFQFTNAIEELSGEGILKLASANFPSITNNYLVAPGGGTVEYNNTSDFNLPSTQTEYNNLIINGSAIATQKYDLTIHGDLRVKQGTYRINDGTPARRQLTIDGNVTVVSGASMTVGTGNTTSGGNVGGGTAPFINYYTTYTHTIVVNGDFTNDGTVRFTNQSYPQYGAFPGNGAATVYFRGPADNTLTCNGQTDFYNLVLDKGTDQTFKLNIYSSAYHNFRLFGRNSYGGDTSSTGGTEQNPNLRKALWIRTGTLVLKGLTVIPSLSEGGDGGTPNSDFYIPVNGALILDGPDVVVLATADDYSEVNAAYGLSGGSNSAYSINEGSSASSFSIYGKLQINDGYFSTRECGGFITWDKASGEFIVNGGVVDAKQFRAAGGADGLASYTQTGGTVILRGQFQRSTSSLTSVSDLVNAPIDLTRRTNGLDGSKGTLNINNPDNIFSMSGGTLKILDLCGTSDGYAIDVFSDEKNISVSGGTVEIAPQKDNYTFKVRSAAPFGNLVINRAAGNSQVQLNNSDLPTGVTISGQLEVLGDIILTNGALNANNFDVTVGGDFSLANGTTYTTGSNRTIFNGANQQKLTVDLSSAIDLNKVLIAKSANELLLDGTQATVNVADSLIISSGQLNDNGKTINVSGNIYNAGEHLGEGQIVMSGASVNGNGSGTFQNISLNRAGDITLDANVTINGTLTFAQDHLLNIGSNNITFSAGASISGASSSRYIKTTGLAGDGGVTYTYTTSATRIWPIGVDVYSPASIGFTAAPTTYGDITIIPVNYEHPTTTTDNESLQYFWRVKSNGFTGITGKVSHQFDYDESDVLSGTENNFLPARYDASAYTWNHGKKTDIDITNNIISDWADTPPSADYISGDYTAGKLTAFDVPKKFYSRRTGLWNEKATWSTVNHTGVQASSIPGASDIVIIGNGHEVSLERTETDRWWVGGDDRDRKNEDVQSCASLQIETGSILDVAYSPGSNFGMVMSHPSGNGAIKVSTQYSSGGVFEFPSGDFSDFNANSGTTELYTINSTSGTTYYLPAGVAEYGNLIIHPVGGSNIIFANHDITILGDLTTQGTDVGSWFSPAWSGGGWNEKTITVKGNLNIEGGSLYWYGNGSVRQDVVIDGDVTVASGAGICSASASNQSLTIGGSFINNSNARDGYRRVNGCYLEDIPVIFAGGTNAKITSTGGTPETTFGTITVNKGPSQAITLTMDIGGTIDFTEDEWLKLLNGTFTYESVSGSTVWLNTNNSFTIPGTAALIHNSTDDFVLCYGNSDNYDLYLNGKLSVMNGRFYVGNSSNAKNVDIEYSGAGLSEIDVQGGELNIAGQVRRNPASSAGILKYKQSGGNITIYGQNARADRAKLEVLNAGSQFDMSGGVLTIVRGGGTTFGDLYLRPENSTVSGGDIVFTNGGVGAQSYLLDANVPLNNLTVNGNGSNATVKLLLSPLELNGDLILSNSRSIFDANDSYNIALTINGDFNNSGTYHFHHNTTTFSGSTQQITGSSAIEFYNLVVNPTTSLALSKDVTVNNELTISNGTLAVGANTINVKGNVINNSNYTSTGNGLVLNGSSVQELSGTGTFDRLELNNRLGGTLLSDLSVEGELALTQGILNIKNYLLSLGETASVSGTFGVGSMITTNGVYSNKGLKKVLPAGASTFTFPVGVAGKYTPALVDLSASGGTASIQIHPVNAKHPANIDAANVLNYYWAVKSEALNGASGSLQLTYDEGDVQGNETNYYGARLLVPGTAWSKNHPVDEGANTITFTISGDDVTGEYTAGLQSAFPDNVPEYTSSGNGVWSNPANWIQTGGDSYTLTGAPNGFIVVIQDEITLDGNFANAYRTTIRSTGKLKIDDTTYGHNLGTVSGDGTLYLEDGQLPEGNYNAFLGCSNNSTLEFGGTAKEYAIIGDLFNNAANLIFSGTGRRTLPDADLTICKQLVIDGPVLDNSVYNRTLFVNGSFTRLSGQFRSGSGTSATVAFVGSAEQYLGGFTGADNAFNNLEVNNAAGLTLNGAVEVGGNLLLTNGLINTTSVNTLTITNTSTSCVTPSAGKATSFVNGPLTKQLNQGDSFIFPIGKDGVIGNKLTISSTRTGTRLWTAEYVRPNATAANFILPLTAINNHEYYTVSTPGGGEAMVQLGWDSGSDITPSMTEYGLTDIRVVNYDGANWQEIASTANGVDTNGQVITNARVNVSAAGTDFTTASVNTNKPKIRLNPSGAVCGNSGIPVDLTTTVPTSYPFNITYKVNNVLQSVLIVNNASELTIPTPSLGVYELVDFKYDGSTMRSGVVDVIAVEVFATPTTANAGADQSLQGLSQATLDANPALVGVGKWRVVSGTGGSFVDPSNPKTVFNGTNGSTYELSWTISNGDCESVDLVTIAFPLLPAHTWVGGVSSDWFDINNWTDKIIPDDTHDVTINAVILPAVAPVIEGPVAAKVGAITIKAGASLIVKPGAMLTVSGDVVTNDGLIIENTNKKPASVIIDPTRTVVGDVTVKWTYDNSHWWFIGHPISTPTIDNYQVLRAAPQNNDYLLYDYQDGANFVKVSDLTEADYKLADQNELRGYQFKVLNSGAEVMHTGPVNNEPDYTQEVVAAGKWQIIANPYPSYYKLPQEDASGADFEHTTGSVYVSDSETNLAKKFYTYNTLNGIVTPVPGGDDTFDGLIAPNQAFYVKSSDVAQVGDVITMRASNRVHDTKEIKTPLKSAKAKEDNIIRIRVTNAAGTDEAVIAFKEYGQLQVTRYDSEKLIASGSGLSFISSIKEGVNTVINVLPNEVDELSIPLMCEAKEGKHSLSINGIESLSGDYEFILEDKGTTPSILTPMSSSTVYEFSSDKGTYDDRFVLHFKVVKTEVPTDIGDVDSDANQVQAFIQKGSTLVVNCDWEGEKQVLLYTVGGRLVISETFNGDGLVKKMSLKPGVYLVKIIGREDAYEQKLYIE